MGEPVGPEESGGPVDLKRLNVSQREEIYCMVFS